MVCDNGRLLAERRLRFERNKKMGDSLDDMVAGVLEERGIKYERDKMVGRGPDFAFRVGYRGRRASVLLEDKNWGDSYWVTGSHIDEQVMSRFKKAEVANKPHCAVIMSNPRLSERAHELLKKAGVALYTLGRQVADRDDEDARLKVARIIDEIIALARLLLAIQYYQALDSLIREVVTFPTGEESVKEVNEELGSPKGVQQLAISSSVSLAGKSSNLPTEYHPQASNVIGVDTGASQAVNRDMKPESWAEIGVAEGGSVCLLKKQLTESVKTNGGALATERIHDTQGNREHHHLAPRLRTQQTGREGSAFFRSENAKWLAGARPSLRQRWNLSHRG
jgi:hypothetical protein